jgi:hypothetical protein
MMRRTRRRPPLDRQVVSTKMPMKNFCICVPKLRKLSPSSLQFRTLHVLLLTVPELVLHVLEFHEVSRYVFRNDTFRVAATKSTHAV